MANQLVYDVLARDRASKTFDKIGNSAERAGKQGSRFGKALKSGMGLAVGAVTAAGLGTMFVGFIQDARESAKIGRLTTAVIASTGGAAKITAAQVGDLATSISNKTGADDEAVQSGANLLLTFTKVRNEVGKGNDIFNQATQASVDMAAALGTDTKAAALQLGKALNDPIKGVTALGKAGVSFTAQQKEQIKTLVESGNVLDAQKIILSEMGTQFGGAAKAAADPLQRLKVIAGNLGEELGGRLLPYIDKGASFLTDFASALLGSKSESDKMTTSAGRLATNVKRFGDFVKDDVLPPTRAFAGFIASDVLPRLGSLAAFVKRNSDFFVPFVAVVGTAIAGFKLYAIVTKAAAATQAALNAVMAANPLGLVVIALAAVAAGLYFTYQRSEKFREVVDGAFKAVATAGRFMWESVLKPTFRFLVDAWLSVAGAIVDGAATAFGWVPGIGGKLKGAAASFNTFKDDVNRSLGSLKDKTITIKAYTGVSNLGSARLNAPTMSTRRAMGGPISGPGTSTSDSIPAWLSNGEHVWTAREVQNLGGHQAMEQLRGMVRAGRVPAFAAGGGVGVRTSVDSGPLRSGIESFYATTVDQVRKAGEQAARQAAAQYEGDPRMLRSGSGASAGMGIVAFGRLLQGMGVRVAEHPAFGGVAPVHKGRGHYEGRAIDINTRAGTSAREQRELRPFVDMARKAGFFTIFMAPGHYGHAHIERRAKGGPIGMATGGVIGERVDGIGASSGRSYSFGESGPETVLPGVHGPGGDRALLAAMRENTDEVRALRVEVAKLPRETQHLIRSR